jgi:hypothetical protein
MDSAELPSWWILYEHLASILELFWSFDGDLFRVGS